MMGLDGLGYTTGTVFWLALADVASISCSYLAA